MWMTLAFCLLAVTSAIADEAKIVPEADPEATLPSGPIPGFDGKLPTPEQLLEMLDSMSDVSEEEKASLREELRKTIENGGSFPAQPPPGSDVPMQTVILFSLLALVALIFVFFVYKLLKCLTEREMKKVEKKKNKQMKKKK